MNHISKTVAMARESMPGGASLNVADRRVHYTALHFIVRVLYRLGTQGTDPNRRGACGKVNKFNI